MKNIKNIIKDKKKKKENIKEQTITEEKTNLKFFHYNKAFKFENGASISELTIAYTSSGHLNINRNNAILICHAFTGDADVLSWWSNFVGKGKAIDTNKYFVICSNVLGGCSGTTGPSSKKPNSNLYYGTDFPTFTIKDIVKVQKILIDSLGIKKLYCVIGGSMGGMQALQWTASYPQMMEKAIIIASTMTHSPMQIAFNEIAREAITEDNEWYGGKYYGMSSPDKGLALARMLGHITYMSEEYMRKKFGRRRKKALKYFTPSFEVENYLHYNGEKFTARFDANSFLYLTKAMDFFDAKDDIKKIKNKKNVSLNKVLIISFISDWLYPSTQSAEIVSAYQHANINTEFYEIESNYGHDAFLIKNPEQTKCIKKFLNS
ncbi:homoserine O-acetyltransferase [Brachyspira innocens]|uniref:Homoserine O-acetyltransferase n=1 Tax=Brachyspira innocens TaxID=13264 RepID=A0ABT8YW02_9SPIR|nr:homoserine O-acetyltransferase [Brachyspira innocens]MDO6994282.1 homoserine O-acetyltransferase [Brachyspira innocens]MDO7020084.1 homoserine O-acetyltransferase [Brachyspira innocens]